MKSQLDPSPWTAEVIQQVQFYDVDSMDVVWHGHYVKYLEVARCALLDKIGYNYLQMKESGYVWPVVDCHLRYVEAVKFGQMIKITASLTEWENRLKIDYLITDVESCRRLTRASTIQVAVDMKTQKMCFASPVVLIAKLNNTKIESCTIP